MMRSLYSGVSGLRIHQTKMDVIGNNIANVNTIGFKSSRVTFSEVFSQTLQGASGASDTTGGTNPMQIGLGAGVSSIDVDMTEGAAQRTDRTLDLKIEGDGFFIVSDATGNKFTRVGAFMVDAAGNLVSSGTGMKVMGWLPDETSGEIVKGAVQKLQLLSPTNLYSEPEATTDVTLSGNIDKDENHLDPGEGGYPVEVEIFDSLGYVYKVPLTLQNSGVDNVYNVVLEADSVVSEGTGETITNDAIAAGTVQIAFDPTTGKVTTSPADFSLTGLSTGYSTFPTAGIKVDFSEMTQFDASISVEGNRGTSNGIGSGNKAGSLNGFSIGQDGTITGNYTNGDSKVLAQLAVATFENAAGLEKVGDSLYKTTNNSGKFDGTGISVTDLGGNIKSGVLEMSNVNLASEFTEMITTQRGFQANSRIITSSDEMLQELVNLKR